MSGAAGAGETVAGAGVEPPEPAVAPAAPAAAPAAGTLPPWMQARLDQMTARMNAAERRREEMERQVTLTVAHNQALSQEVAALRSAGAAGAGGAAAGTGQRVEAPGVAANPPPVPNHEDAVQAAAEKMLAERQTLEEQNASVARGKALHPDFEQTLGQLRNLGGVPAGTLEMAMQTGAAEHVLYALGKDLNKASEIFALPPGRQAIELAKLAAPPAKTAPATSGAPAPMAPIGGRGSPSAAELKDDMPMEEWLARRTEQKRARAQ